MPKRTTAEIGYGAFDHLIRPFSKDILHAQFFLIIIAKQKEKFVVV